MTTGNVITDLRQTASTDAGTVLVGLYRRKTWSGTDDPVNHKANNAYTMNWFEERDGVINWSNPLNGTHGTGSWLAIGGPVIPDVSFDTNDNLTLVNHLGDSIRRHSFNAASSVGAEGLEALKQVTDATKNVTKGMNALAHGNMGAAAKAFGLSPKAAAKAGLHKDLSNRVLATQLGWLPLLGDIKDAATALHALTSKPLTKTYHGRITKRGPVLTATPTISGGRVTMGEVFASKRITWTLSEQLSWAQSLSISNPWDLVDGIWNATRLSFIADWFIPINGYLTARSLAASLTGSGYTSEYVNSHCRGVDRPGTLFLTGADIYYQRNVHLWRVPLTSISSLTALPKFKSFSEIPSWRHALTAVTLATQMFL